MNMRPIHLILFINSLFLERISIRILSLGFLMSFLFCGNVVYGQPKSRSDIGKLYDTGIIKYLIPPSENSLSIIYLEKPSFDAEYSFHIVEFEDSIKLVLDFFQESYWYQLFKHFLEFKNANFEPQLSHYSILVSHRFKDKMQLMFSKTISSKLTYAPPSGIHVDGTNYLFRLLKDEDTEWEIHQPIQGSMAYKAAAICSEIAFTLKNDSFNELKVIEAIESSGF